MSRVDLFTTIHKALRAALFETTAEVARADYRAAAPAAAACARVRALLALLDEHAAHEDALLLPVIGEAAPAVGVDLHTEHLRIGGLQVELVRLMNRIEVGGDLERGPLGARLHAKLCALVAAHLAHMEREEGEGNRILQAHRSDAELAALRAEMQARLAPGRLATWMTLLLPAASPAERSAVLGGLGRTLPAERFAEVTRGARAALAGGAWDAALAEAGLVARA